MIIFSSNSHVLEFIMTVVQCEHGSNTRILVVFVNAKLCSEIFESRTFIAIFKLSLRLNQLNIQGGPKVTSQRSELISRTFLAHFNLNFVNAML